MKFIKSNENGNVIVEFIGITVSLLVPLSIIASACIAVASGYLSTDVSARTAARAFVTSPTDAIAKKNAISTAQLSAEDFDSSKSRISTKISCSKKPCLSPGGFVTVKVNRDVSLNLPRIFGSRVVRVTSQHTLVVDELRSK